MTDQPFLPESLTSDILALSYVGFMEAPDKTDPELRAFFSTLNGEAEALLKSRAKAALLSTDKNQPDAPHPYGPTCDQATIMDSIRAVMLIRATRMRGHIAARLDPLELVKPLYHAELDPVAYGFGEKDMDRPIFLGGMLGLQTATMRKILSVLRGAYAGSIGLEFMHIQNPAQKAWIQEHFENHHNKPVFAPEEKKEFLRALMTAECFEHFMGKRFPSVQRFSLEGGESLYPLLLAALQRSAELGLEEIVLGMAHRGRLNILANLMDKPLPALFGELQGSASKPDCVFESLHATGDLKYHLGCSTNRVFGDHPVHLSMTANPSHLEIVGPVVMGRVRAKQRQRTEDAVPGGEARHRVMGILVHGDAAFAAQGIVSETMMLSDLEGYSTGGTLHIVVNNQIGFTTPPSKAHSGLHCTDVAKIVQAPIFHVNADDIEAVIHVAEIAAAYRQKFHHDVVIDLVCYRRNGHSEKDEPALTGPLMTAKIKAKPSTCALYAAKLVAEGTLTEADAELMRASCMQKLEEAANESLGYKAGKADWLEGHWMGYAPPPAQEQNPATGLPEETLSLIGERLTTLPDDFEPHPFLTSFLEKRAKALRAGGGIDWGLAEALAFGSLALEKTPVRLSGQDCERGTFMQRQAVWLDQITGKAHYPFKRLDPDQASVDIINSPLSEAAVMGFDYGYSLASPESLVCWEAQFGDFVNGAQIIIDQFLSSAEAKWLRLSGMVLLLPHGYEGQGPEHSSARLERFLQLCAENNMQVANCTTPANYFHILRRQMVRNYRKPLVLMTPKSLLRHPFCVSSLKDMGSDTRFTPVLGDPSPLLAEAKSVRRVLLCSGKVAYDLFAARQARKIHDIAIVRLEQFYPFPAEALQKALLPYAQAEIVWCQEEPANCGAACFVERRLPDTLKSINNFNKLVVVSRPESAATAVGSPEAHKDEQERLMNEAFR